MPSSLELPLASGVIERAGLWWARIQADDASPVDHTACADWRAEHPDHERAWQGLLAFDAQLTTELAAVPAPVAQHVLCETAAHRQRARTRRQLLGLAFLAPATAGIAYLGKPASRWHIATADYRSATGENRPLTLTDGTQLLLGSATAVDVHYTQSERLIVLHAGHIMVTSAADAHRPARPLRVHTPHGQATALGTRFAVHLNEDATHLEVFEGAVQVTPDKAPNHALRIEAGQTTHFTHRTVNAQQPVSAGAESWTNGMLSVSDMPLGDVLAHLARYRTGLLHYDPAVAHLRVTGVFPLHATDRALHNLTLGLPVRLHYRTRYWVTVRPL